MFSPRTPALPAPLWPCALPGEQYCRSADLVPGAAPPGLERAIAIVDRHGGRAPPEIVGDDRVGCCVGALEALPVAVQAAGGPGCAIGARGNIRAHHILSLAECGGQARRECGRGRRCRLRPGLWMCRDRRGGITAVDHDADDDEVGDDRDEKQHRRGAQPPLPCRAFARRAITDRSRAGLLCLGVREGYGHVASLQVLVLQSATCPAKVRYGENRCVTSHRYIETSENYAPSRLSVSRAKRATSCMPRALG